ncbi:MAG: bifunctional nuclease family protein [Candidatus Dadabacteria bacterium]|nr:MAG: bifunctional nuclease family protein [Candidatus Dadabacteria bacterium]
MYVKMKIAAVALDPRSKGPVVVLRDTEGRYTLPIWIGVLEAASIAYALEGVNPPRPMTHDLLKMILEELGASVGRIDIDALEDNVFHAKIHLELPGGGKRLIDSRPSDAMAIALRTGAEIFAEEGVLRRAAAVEVKEGESSGTQGEEDPWKEFLENLDPEAFGKYKM